VVFFVFECEFFGEGFDEAGASVDEAGVDLDEGGTEVEFALGGVEVHDAAYSDDGELALGFFVDELDDLVGAVLYGEAAEATGFVDGFKKAGAGDGGVGSDDAVVVEVEEYAEEFGDFFFFQVWGDFDEDGEFGLGELLGSLTVGFLEFSEEASEVGFVLELSETGGVGAADVDGKVVCLVCEGFESGDVIFGGVFEGGGFAFAEVDAEGNGALVAFGKVFGDSCYHAFGSFVVEAHSVDDGFVVGIAKEAGAFVAGLANGGDGAGFYVSKAHGGKGGEGSGIFVHAGCEADGVGKG